MGGEGEKQAIILIFLAVFKRQLIAFSGTTVKLGIGEEEPNVRIWSKTVAYPQAHVVADVVGGDGLVVCHVTWSWLDSVIAAAVRNLVDEFVGDEEW